jgi:oligopeptide transport system permease protein
MLTFALKRLLVAIPTLWVLMTLSFFMMRAAPGGPFDGERALPPEIEAAMRAQYHLDESLAAQYGRYMAGLVRGDLGPSFQYVGYSVGELLAQGVPVSLLLGFWALVVALLLGGAAGTLAAIRQHRAADTAVMLGALAGISIPPYVTAPLLILLFAVVLGWLPAGGWGSGSVADMVLPVLVLAAPQVAYVARLLRASLIDVLRSPYIRTARAKGLRPPTVLLRHALPAALLPVVSYLGPAAAGLITGSVVVEQIFNIPGIGRYFVQAALNRDYTLVLGVVGLYGVLIILFNFIVDLLYGWLDPRMRPA